MHILVGILSILCVALICALMIVVLQTSITRQFYRKRHLKSQQVSAEIDLRKLKFTFKISNKRGC